MVNGAEDTRKYFEENLAKAVEMAAKAGIVMGFETMETPFSNNNLANSFFVMFYPSS